MTTYAYGAVAGTDKATILKLRQRVSYLEAALKEALATPQAVTITHPAPVKQAAVRTPTTTRSSGWNRVDWSTPEARKSIHDTWLTVHHNNTEKPGAGAQRLQQLGREVDAQILETRAIRNLARRAA